jgi:peptidylprolyl isomerase
VHYSGKLEDGTEFDSSLAGHPMELTIGEGEILAAFEDALIGMAPGESKTVDVPASAAHGPHSPDLVREVDRSRIPNADEVEIGTRISGSVSGGYPVYLRVLDITDDTVTVDLNHPLAGEDLRYEISLVEIL